VFVNDGNVSFIIAFLHFKQEINHVLWGNSFPQWFYKATRAVNIHDRSQVPLKIMNENSWEAVPPKLGHLDPLVAFLTVHFNALLETFIAPGRLTANQVRATPAEH
jgi:hypothetical protein